jgi:hypothetical protein
VVRNLLNAVAADDQTGIEAAINPIYADKPAEVGVGDLVDLRGKGEVELKNVSITTEYDADRRNARVFVAGTASGKGVNIEMNNRVILTSMEGERWYVTSPNSEYWSAQLKPAPNTWAQAQEDNSPTLPGTYYPPHPGKDGQLGAGSDDRAHVSNETTIPLCTAEQVAENLISDPLCYTSNPPTSGPHAASWAPFRVFNQPVAKEFVVHSMEHGGVAIWYNTANTQVIQQLTALTEANINKGKELLLTPYPGMEADTIAVTSWTRLDKFPVAQFNIDRVQKFIDAHERRFNPEGF